MATKEFIDAIRFKDKYEKNEPLSTEELKKEENNIVYCTPINDQKKVTLARVSKEGIFLFGVRNRIGWEDIIENYGKTWVAFRKMPEEWVQRWLT